MVMRSRSTALPQTASFGPGLRLALRLAQRCVDFSYMALIALRRQHDIRHLRQLDDRMLADVGIKRHQIETAVRGGRYGLRRRRSAR